MVGHTTTCPLLAKKSCLCREPVTCELWPFKKKRKIFTWSFRFIFCHHSFFFSCDCGRLSQLLILSHKDMLSFVILQGAYSTPLCMHVLYLCIMNCVKCIYIYSVYVLIYSCSTWPLFFCDASEGRVEERTLHYLPGGREDTTLVLAMLLLNQIENQETIIVAASGPLVPLLCLG